MHGETIEVLLLLFHLLVTSKINTVTSQISNSISDFIKRNFLNLMNPKTHHIQWIYFYSCYPNMSVFW